MLQTESSGVIPKGKFEGASLQDLHVADLFWVKRQLSSGEQLRESISSEIYRRMVARRRREAKQQRRAGFGSL